ncbi:sorting and assembly machinery component 50 [Biomphalaria glabrata]|uniref:Sorting and assembly machinery component 50 homolog isoform X2 n=1 Tax=Biomphalaria glabrata TaxID=6526 RepID=A0A9W3BM68_BIOGL|nr:sorting and assembly machinery component 50 homolog isoform X2 [Biomphalaria glabrata]KAI8761007.1 sorting and assembly machinery component 50-like protein A [Biomphalaria glabrata]
MGTVQAKALSDGQPKGIKTSSIPIEKKNDPSVIIFDKLPVRVQRVVVDGLTRTKDDIIIKEIKPLLSAKTFEELVHLSYGAKVKMERLGLFKNVVIAIDVSKDKRENGYEVLFEVQEFRRVDGGIYTSISNNDGSLDFQVKMPNILGRGERFSLDYTVGTKRTHGYSAYFRKPLNNNPDMFVGSTLYQFHGEYPWSGYKQTDRGIGFDFTFPTFLGSHNLQWEAVWRDLKSLSRETSFAVREQAGHSLKSCLKHTFSIDKRDDPILPTTGFLWQTSQEYAGLGGNVEYAKQDGTFQWNVSLPLDTIFQVSLAGGIMRTLDPRASISISDKFFLGGPLTLRGFNMRGCGPHSHENALGADSYWLTAAHIYSPLPFRPGKGRFGDLFKTHFFINAGNLGNIDFSNLSGSVSSLISTLRWSYGAGVVLCMGRSARLELNYVIPMRIQKGDKANAGLQFGIGIQFL